MEDYFYFFISFVA